MTSAKCVQRDTGWRLVLAALFLGPTLAPVPLARAEEAHPGQRLETLYSEAVIAYNKKDYARSMTVINELLALNPKNFEALQLKALTAKATKNDTEAIKVYNQLLALKPESERGPYYFELGVIYDQHKQTQWARPYFQRAILRKFNVEASHLFLALEYFNAGDSNAAERHFDVVADSANSEMRAVGRYYRAIILLKAGFGSLGLGDLIEAREAADATKDSATAKNISAAAVKMLAPFDKPQWFGNLTLFPQYDSNLSQATTANAAASGISAIKGNLSGGFGRVGSPMGSWQTVASLRGTANYNVGVQGTGANDYQYLTATPSIYVSRKPMGRSVFGFKLEPTITGQYGSTSSGTIVPELYSVTGDVGIFWRLQAGKSFQLQFDWGSHPQYYFTSGDYTSFANGYFTFSGKSLGNSFIFNPGFNLGGEYNGATGSSAAYIQGNAGVSNTMKFGADDQAILSFNGAYYNYMRSSPARTDTNLLGRLTYIHNFTPTWSLSFDGSYTMNISSEATSYTYNRFTAGLGLSWTL